MLNAIICKYFYPLGSDVKYEEMDEREEEDMSDINVEDSK